jgi:hypothetical protein
MRWKRGSRLKLVDDAGAPPRTREIFDEVRHELGLPTVPLLYQSYAVYPEFLELHWQALRPAVQTRQFFSLGARLAAEAYTRAHNYFDVAGLPWHEDTGAAAESLSLSQVLDYYQYLDPLLLLVAVTQLQALEGPVGQEQSAAEPAQHPNFVMAPRLVSDAAATPALHRIWEERRRLLDLAFISDEHRALAEWPHFYQDYWLSLKQLLRSPLYSDCQGRIVESAWGLVRELPVRVETGVQQLVDSGLDTEEISSIARINEAFMQALGGLLLDVTFARIACEKGPSYLGRQETAERPAKKAGTSPQAA